jgi:hypothetical protein
MNKFVLKVTLIDNDDFGVEIDILHWDPRYISNIQDKSVPFKYFQSLGQFTLYSQGSGAMFENCLEIPDHQHLHDENGKFIGSKIKKNFYSDENRYSYLKLLYHCLSEWSIKYKLFLNDPFQTNKISLNNNYWIR